jgi:hypothetical protein
MTIPRGAISFLAFCYARKLLKEAEFAKGSGGWAMGTGEGG